MNGRLHILQGKEEWEVDLPKDRFLIGASPSDDFRLEALGVPGALAFQWDARAASWNLQTGHRNTTVNGRAVTTGVPIALNHNDRIELPDLFLRFDRFPADCTLEGVAVDEIELGAGLIIGRPAPDGSDLEGELPKLVLDPEDSAISKTHAVITASGNGFVIRDESRFGTELNGKSFREERLIFGDRFKIRDYIFEFTGQMLRRLDRNAGGAIRARDLTFKVGERTILQGVSLDVRRGEFIGILGGSGQGKSTLLNALCGINPATSGEVHIGGIPLTDRSAMAAAGIGFVPQDDIVHRELTVREALVYSARLRLTLPHEEIAALVERTIDRLGLAEHAMKRVAMLSGGQRKRVSIGIELLAKPSVLFLDEPSSGLDPATEESLMALLQSLTLTNLTVVCTTHVLQKAYLFDRILFIQGGRLVFAGDPDEARRHFFSGASTDTGENLQRSPLERIYSLLVNSTEPAEYWETKFRQSAFADRLLSSDPLPARQDLTEKKASAVKPAGFLGALAILLQRQWRILIADKLNLLFLLAQAAVIGSLISWVSDDESLRLFLSVIATMWFGCSNGAQQIVSELPIFRRERVCGLGMNPYILSKGAFLLLLTASQAVLLFFTMQALSHLFNPREFDATAARERIAERIAPPVEARKDIGSDEDPLAEREVDPFALAKPKAPEWQVSSLLALAWFFDIEHNITQSGERPILDSAGETLRNPDGTPRLLPAEPVGEVLLSTLGLRAAALLLAALAGVGMGLTISALVQTPTQAVMWVPLILIPQILFGGYVVKLSEMTEPVRAVSGFMPSCLVQRVMDVSNIYGQTTPFLSNRTKTPLFLTPDGSKETVKWTDANGKKLSQDYDKLSEFNTSWQNLLIDSPKVGQHKQAHVGTGALRKPRDSVEVRNDVRYEKGTLFRFIGPALNAAGLIGIWIAVCYTLVFAGLATRQTGK